MSSYYLYILANTSRTTYVGLTDNLQREIQHYRAGKSEFIAREKVTRLVHFEEIDSLLTAVARERAVKGWSRAKQDALVEQSNSKWNDLAEKW
jgi:putative endonuclease